MPDEPHGRPLGTRNSSRIPIIFAVTAIGAVGAVTVWLSLIAFVLAGVAIVLA